MPSRGHRLATSVLVVGTGGAGLRAAIELAEAGFAVLVVGNRTVEGAHTALASGGISASLPSVGAEDTWQQHAADTLQESCLLAHPLAVERVVRGAAGAVYDLERFGVRFDRDADGRLATRWYGAHTYRRTVFAGVHTGREIQRALGSQAARLQVPVLTTCYVTRLLVNEGTVFGAYGFDLVDGSRYLVHADAIILATGGHTRLWRRTTARRGEHTGDSFRLAVEAGLGLVDPEMVQFHPFGLIAPDDASGTLVPEATREGGATLLNSFGERFMERYDPERKELAGRDLVTRATYAEICAGRGTPAGGVWLDLSHLPGDAILSRYPEVHRTILHLQGTDVTQDPVEVAPTAHYSMGGVRVSPTDNSTDIAGLFVIGEAASGVHGANRLGGNSLVELLVTGKAAGRAAGEYAAGLTVQRRSLGAVSDAEADLDRTADADGGQDARALQRSIRAVMTNRAGPLRDRIGLQSGLAELRDIADRAEDVTVLTDIGGYRDLAHAFELRSALVAARATLECALEREESRGSHQRTDHPVTKPAFQANLVWSPHGRVTRATLPPVPTALASLMHEVSADGKLLE